eukprot:CFRG1522T1
MNSDSRDEVKDPVVMSFPYQQQPPQPQQQPQPQQPPQQPIGGGMPSQHGGIPSNAYPGVYQPQVPHLHSSSHPNSMSGMNPNMPPQQAHYGMSQVQNPQPPQIQSSQGPPSQVQPPLGVPSQVQQQHAQPSQVQPPQIQSSQVLPSQVQPPLGVPSQVQQQPAQPSQVQPPLGVPSRVQPPQVPPSQVPPSQVLQSQAQPLQVPPSQVQPHQAPQSHVQPPQVQSAQAQPQHQQLAPTKLSGSGRSPDGPSVSSTGSGTINPVGILSHASLPHAASTSCVPGLMDGINPGATLRSPPTIPAHSSDGPNGMHKSASTNSMSILSASGAYNHIRPKQSDRGWNDPPSALFGGSANGGAGPTKSKRRNMRPSAADQHAAMYGDVQQASQPYGQSLSPTPQHGHFHQQPTMGSPSSVGQMQQPDKMQPMMQQPMQPGQLGQSGIPGAGHLPMGMNPSFANHQPKATSMAPQIQQQQQYGQQHGHGFAPQQMNSLYSQQNQPVSQPHQFGEQGSQPTFQSAHPPQHTMQPSQFQQNTGQWPQ